MKKQKWISFVVAGMVAFVGAIAVPGLEVFAQAKFQPKTKIVHTLKKSPAYVIADITLEGMTEQVRLDRKIGTDGKYLVYVDLERYKFIKGKEGDLIVPKTPLPDDYPFTGITMEHRPTQKVDDSVKEVVTKLQSQYETVSTPEQVDEPVKGWMIKASSGSDWNSPRVKVYITKDKNGSYILSENYFVAASEGHSVRFDAMLNYFSPLKK